MVYRAVLFTLLLACPPKPVDPESISEPVEEAEEPLVKSGWEGFPDAQVLDDLGTVEPDAESVLSYVGTTWYLIDLDPEHPADLTVTFYEDGSFELHGWGHEGMEWAATEDHLVFWVNHRYSHHAAVSVEDGSLVGVGRQKDGYSWRFRMIQIGPVSASSSTASD